MSRAVSRLQAIFLCALLCLVGVIYCQDEDDDDLNLDPDDIVAARIENNSPAFNARIDNDSPASNETECKTESGENGVCVTYYRCEYGSKTLIEDGYTLIDARALDQCPQVLDICCLRNQVATSTPSPKSSKSPTKVDVTTNIVADVPESVLKSLSKEGAESPAERSMATDGNCGFSYPGGTFTIRDGMSPSDRVYAEFGEFPWMVAILKRSEDEVWSSTNYIGGGSLIHPLVVMTVAHKLKNLKANQITIRAGEYDTNSEEELGEHQDRNVAKIIVHPSYFRRSMYNDIALLILQAPVVPEAPHIGIGCLAPQLPPPGTECFSMGWGATNFANRKVFASILKKVKVPLVEKSKCEENLRKTHLGRFFRLHGSLVCAGGEEGMWCNGDGGSSLVCPLDAKGSRFAIYGMVAYGVKCGRKDVPGVYVNVPKLHEWVGEQLVSEGLDSKPYTI